MSSVRISRLTALPLVTLLCSLGLRLAFACGEQPTGLPLTPGPSAIVPVIGSPQSVFRQEKTTLFGVAFSWWD